MKFKFAFTTLMKERKIRQDEARREFLQASQRVEEQVRILGAYRESLARAIDQIQRVRSGAGQVAGSLIALDEFVKGQKIRIQGQIRTVQGLEEIANQKRLVLVEAAREVKVLEKLKEKQYNEFKKQRLKHELKAIDEIAVMRAARREVE